MEMLREIDEETVDFIPNYDGRVQEPTVLPSRFPNLLANGSGGIAVGMATNIPPHNLRRARRGGVLVPGQLRRRRRGHAGRGHRAGQGPRLPHLRLDRWLARDFTTPTTPGRGSIRMRGVVEIEEDSRGRTGIVITELPYQVNHDNFITSIAEQVRDGKLDGISNIEDQSSDRVGLRIVVELKRDAVAKVVLNNLYKHTQLQTSFGANMLSIVDGVPRTLRLDQLIRLLRRPSTRRHRPAHHLPAAQGQRARPHPARSGQGARRARRSDRVDPRVGDRRRRAAGPDRAARHRRDPGAGDPRHAVAPPGRPGTSAHRRRPGQDRGRDRRPRRHPGQAGAPARHRARRAQGDRRQVRRRPADPDRRRPTARSPTRT